MTYADSSVIVKRYYQEIGSDRVRQEFTAAEHVFTSRLAYAEVHAALARKRRERALSERDFRRCAMAFETDWLAYDHIAIDAVTLAAVPRLVRQYPLRDTDAVHLAAAIWLRDQAADQVELWAADSRLVEAARRERLKALNPEI